MNRHCKRFGHEPSEMSLLLAQIFKPEGWKEVVDTASLRPCTTCEELFSPHEDDERLQARRKRQDRWFGIASIAMGVLAVLIVILAAVFS